MQYTRDNKVREFFKTLLSDPLESVFFLILGVGVSIRALALFIQQDFWHDAAFTYLYAKESLQFIVAGNDVHPPLYYLIVKLFMFVSESELLLRGLSILFFIGFMFGVYFLSRRLDLSDNSKAFIYAVFAFAPTIIWYSIEPRNYMLGMMLAVWQFFFFMDFIEEMDDFMTYFMFVILSVLLFYTHFFASLLFVAELLIAVVLGRGAALKTFLSMIIVGLCSIPLVYYVYLMVGQMHSFWFKDIDLISLMSSFVYQFVNPEHVAPAGLIIIFIIGLFCLIIYALVRAGISLKVCKQDESLVFFVVFAVPLFLLWGISQFSPMYHHRYFLFFAFGLVFFLAYGIDTLKKKEWRIGLAFAFIVVLTLLAGQSIYPSNLAEGQAAVKNYLKMNGGVGSQANIIHISTFSQSPFKFYFRDYAGVNNYLLNPLSDKVLFTAGGSVIKEWERITLEEMHALPNKIFVVDDEHYEAGNHTFIYDKGGLKIYVGGGVL